MTNQIANTTSTHPSSLGRRATIAITAARRKASGQLIRSMRSRMIGDLDAPGDIGDHRPMGLPWWLPFGEVPEVPTRRLAGDLGLEAAPPQVLDVRTGAEFRRGHVRGAIASR